MKKIKVLIVEDSKVISDLLTYFMKETEDIEVIGHAYDGLEAIKLTQKLKPDLITMDILMPKLDGFKTTEKIMEECPTPIVVISSTINDKEMNTTFNALNAGALAAISKPINAIGTDFEKIRENIIRTIRIYSAIKVVRRRKIDRNHISKEISSANFKTDIKIIAFGTSTGGPEALNFILSKLPTDFPCSIAIVQHISKNFISGLISWLQKNCKLTIKIAEHFEIMQPGKIYFAPDNFHLVIKSGEKPRAFLEDSAPIDHFKPSATQLFNSIAKAYPQQAIGAVLTGMGRDGADGLLSMHQKGCHTFAQDEASSIVFGMPNRALALQAVDKLVALTEIPNHIIYLLKKGGK